MKERKTKKAFYKVVMSRAHEEALQSGLAARNSTLESAINTSLAGKDK